MGNLYYRIWVDGILKIKENPLRKEDWKWMIQAYVGIAMTLNLVLILFLINYLGFTDKMLILEFEILPFKKLNSFLRFFVSYMLPFLTINYYLIFYNEKYKKLIEIYPFKDGKLFTKYILGSFLGFILFFMILFLIHLITKEKCLN